MSASLYGKIGFTGVAAIVSFYGATRPAPPTSPKEQKKYHLTPLQFPFWNVDTYEVEDSAMGFIKMKNGTLINLRTSWALNYMDAREAATTLCGTKEGAEIKYGGSYPKAELIFNHVRHGKMTEEALSEEALVDYFEGVNEPAGVIEVKQWIDAIINDKEPCVKPEEALRVTEILEAIYKASENNQSIKFD